MMHVSEVRLSRSLKAPLAHGAAHLQTTWLRLIWLIQPNEISASMYLTLQLQIHLV